MNLRSFRRSLHLGLPVAALAASGFAVSAFASATASNATASNGAPSDAFGSELSVQDDEKAKKPIGRSRLSGKKAPPKAAPVPAATPVVKRPAVTPGTVGKTGGAAPGQGPIVQKPGVQLPTAGKAGGMTPEQQKRQQEYLAKQKLANGGKGVGRSAVPRPPRNPNAKLEIEFGTDKHDFGQARQGDQLTHVFEMKSAGTEPLVISQASPTCGCTLGEIKVKNPGDEVSELYKFGDTIEPGAEIELEATLDTASKTNRTNVRINIYSNDGTAGQNQLSLIANVEPFINATPKFLQLGEIREGVSKTATVDFRTSSREAIMLTQDATRPIPLPQGLSMDLAAINPTDEGKSNHWRATFTISDESTAEPKGWMLRLNSDVPLPVSEKVAKAAKPGTPTVYQASTNINYRILGALSLQPQYVSLGLVRPGQPVVRNVRLTCHEPEFDLSGVKVKVTGEGANELAWADAFAATVKPVAGANAVDVELRLKGLPEDADGSFRGRVEIETGHPSKPQEFFRFSGVCRKLSGQGAAPVQRPGQAKPAQKGMQKPAQQPVKKAAPVGGGGQR